MCDVYAHAPQADDDDALDCLDMAADTLSAGAPGALRVQAVGAAHEYPYAACMRVVTTVSHPHLARGHLCFRLRNVILIKQHLLCVLYILLYILLF